MKHMRLRVSTSRDPHHAQASVPKNGLDEKIVEFKAAAYSGGQLCINDDQTDSAHG